LKDYLSLFRWQNLLIIAVAQILVKYALFEPFKVTSNLALKLDGFQFSALVVATLCIAAAGYIINDINDVETDNINKPQKNTIGKNIKEQTAFNLFIGFNIVGVGLGYYLSNDVGNSGFVIVFILTSLLLYLYASYLKHIIVVSNIVISLLVSISLLIVGVFDLVPVITSSNQQTQFTFFSILLDYALFAFLITFLRELAKDLEDIDGDYKAGINTLPIAIGRDRATKVLFGLIILSLILIISYVLNNLYTQEIAVGYFLVGIVGPLLFLAIKTYSAKTKQHYSLISLVLKIIMVIGLLSMLLYKYILLE